MHPAGVSTRRIEDVGEILWGAGVSAGTVSNLNDKAFKAVDEWRCRPLACECGSVPKVGAGLGSREWPQAVRGTENRLECRHSSACYAASLPGIGLSATTSAMILAACSAAVPS